ncbi:protein kinase [Histoplasma capsulatum H143]|uniref:Protein kinase n=1 Tax=Ajellomyces capsulatus (strain H143) TaxID=544712 RepID=C6H9E9_AJECH|nr:protein kinase [Histoplasma capsulatum H143]
MLSLINLDSAGLPQPSWQRIEVKVDLLPSKSPRQNQLSERLGLNLGSLERLLYRSCSICFAFSGSNGTHQCLVTDAARINIHEAKEAANHRLLISLLLVPSPHNLYWVCKFIHSQGIVHGDLHLANILLRFPLDMQDVTLEQLHARTGEPAKEYVVREDGTPLDPGVPSEVVVPVWLGLSSDEVFLADSAIVIADFGEAFDPRVTRRFSAHTPLSPPESHFAEPGESDDHLSFPGDIPPFEAFPITLDRVTIEHVEMLGRLPDRWWSKWEERRNRFDEDGHQNVKETLRQWYGNSARDWTQRFMEFIQHPRERMRFDTFSTEDENAFCDMMKSMLVLEPRKRATIEEVVGYGVDAKMGPASSAEM